MDYRELFQEENKQIQERYELCAERIAQIPGEETQNPRFNDYFQKVAEFILLIEETARMVREDEWKKPLAELREHNERLYRDIDKRHYPQSYANPDYAVRILGEDYGKLLSLLYTEIRGMIVYAYEQRYQDLTICMEIFLQIYSYFCDETEPAPAELQDALYWFFSDYLDVTVPYRIREKYDPALDFAVRIVNESDLKDERYLYYYGEYISDAEREMAAFLAKMPEERLQAIADTFSEGIHKGFLRAGKDVGSKKTVSICYPIGTEQIVKRAIRNFDAMGWQALLYRPASNTVNKGYARDGYVSTQPNPQYEYDHRFDKALFFDKAYAQRRTDMLRQAYEEYRDRLSEYAGIALLETFGETMFMPENKDTAFKLRPEQQQLQTENARVASELYEQYCRSEETSYTIMALPTPEIGADFREIFEATVETTNLKEDTYRQVQQVMIDALDQASYVRVKGQNGNRTDLKVMLTPLADPEKETKFENCLADVNIPLGEVFTSPRLTGTEGVLHASQAYLRGLPYRDLELTFRDGMIFAYRCGNFETVEENQTYIKENLLHSHETLPLGEFAIGTNTTAYAMAKRFGILQKLPILIVEKTGPHFAVGDTCYSWEEEARVYNPDGKEIIAKENECSLKRFEKPEEAYFNCHTDITIPYEEIAFITAVKENGEEITLLRNGRFVLPGTELLNEALKN